MGAMGVGSSQPRHPAPPQPRCANSAGMANSAELGSLLFAKTGCTTGHCDDRLVHPTTSLDCAQQVTHSRGNMAQMTTPTTQKLTITFALNSHYYGYCMQHLPSSLRGLQCSARV